ncbi:hypothetical protein Droror1_Dr00028334 [Drosera rotundifolia]
MGPTSPPSPPPPPPPPTTALCLPPPSPAAAETASLAPGFRFHPTDQELVSYYLKRKVCGRTIRFDAIAETDIYKSEPWNLPDMSRLKSRDNEWYFFGVQDRKYVNGSRVNRATGKGYWKATGNDRPILHNNRTVGMKKTLVFYSGRAPCGKRTNWVMHEYRLTDEDVTKEGIALDAYLLCKILKKTGPGFKPGEQYGPFVDEEWEKDDSGLMPGADTEDDTLGNDDVRLEDSTQSISDATLVASSGLPRETQQILPLCKLEGTDEDMVDPEPFPVVPNKRLRHGLDSSHSNTSEISTNRTQIGPCSFSTGNTNSTPQLLELPLLDSVGSHKERSPCHHSQVDIIDINVTPSYLKLFEELRNSIYKISIEKESLKIEVMSARTMINILQGKIEHLGKENEDLKRISQEGLDP